MSPGTTNSVQFHSRASDVAQAVSYSALDFFKKPSVLINYEGSHDQKVSPQVGCRGPQLDFIVSSDNRNLVDFNKIVLDVPIYKADGKTPAEEVLPLCFANNTLHSLFDHAEVFLDGILVSSSNNAYHHAAFIETEMTTDLDAKTTWARYQGYEYQAGKTSGEELAKWKNEKYEHAKFQKTNYGCLDRLILTFSNVKKIILPGITLHIRLHRSSNDFVLTSLDSSSNDE